MEKHQGKVKFAIVGYGRIGKRHAAMIEGNAEAELIAIADTDEKKALETNVSFYPDLQKMLDTHPEIDVLNVCTPNGYHVPHSLVGLEADCHIVCEKPMGLTRSGCEEVLHKSIQANKLVFCVMQNRYSPPSKWLHEIITKKALGEIYMVSINCYWNRDERYYKKNSWKGTKAQDGGPLFTQFSHFVDLMYWLFGEITNIQTSLKDFNHKELTEFEDSGIVQFEFVNGGIGNINYSTSVWDRNLESSITIIGEKGSVKVGGQYMDKVLECHIEDYIMPELPEIAPPNDYGDYKGSAANHHYVIQNVIDTLKGNNVATTNAEEGQKTVEIIEKIYAAAGND